MIDYFTQISYAKYAPDSFQFFHVRVGSSYLGYLISNFYLLLYLRSTLISFVFGASSHTKVHVKRNIYQHK